jgi:dipeptidyl aminopeptidase/acylaminoacyl peptidase
MKRLLLLLFLGLLAGNVDAQQKRPFAIDDLYRLKSMEDPQISPDGKSVAFVARESNLKKGTTNADIYVVSIDGTRLRRLTTDPAADVHPRWSPDGSGILFTSTRKNGSQAWLLPMDGGEPKQLTDLACGVSDPAWLPGGNGIVFTAEIYPECGTDPECHRRNDRTISEGPLRAYMADELLYRHWSSWREGKWSHVLTYDLEKRALLDLTPGAQDAPSFSLGGAGFIPSPDGKEICYVANRDSVEALSTNKDLWVVPVTGGAPVNLTAANRAYDADPAYSPDGKYLAYRLQTVPGYEADRFRLALRDRTSGATTVLTEAFDNWVNDFQWAPDSRSIFFLADVQGHVPLYALDLASKKIRLVVDAKTIDAFDIAPGGKTIVFIRRSVGEPQELWSVSSDGKNLKRLTTLNREVEETVDIRPAEEIWIASPTGRRIHTFIVKPHGFDPAKRYPLILNVHGGPQMQWADAFRGDWQVYPGSGYIVAFPNPHGSTGYGQEFTAAISRDWGGKVYEDVMAVADSLARLPYVDPARMGAMGWSYGGYMMMWLEGKTTPFKALAAMMGVYNLKAMHGATEELWFPEWDLGGAPWESPLYDRWSPHLQVKNFKTPCLVITGERDYRVPYTQSLEFFTDLQRMGVPSRLIVFKNDGHWPSGVKSMPFYYNAHLDWFHRYLGGPPAPYDMKAMLKNQAFGD